MDMLSATYASGRKQSPWLIAVILVVAIVIIEFAVAGIFGIGQFAPKASSTWSAVFLNDDEIFFGHITTNNSNQLELTDVFYLQRTQPPQGTQAPAQLSINSLVSSQIQCPTDDITLDQTNILYRQDLQSNSFVVQKLNQLIKQPQKCFTPAPAAAATPTP
jgi:hypothetical protein